MFARTQPRWNAALPVQTYEQDPDRMALGLTTGETPAVWSAVNYPDESESQFTFEAFFLRYQRQAEAKAIIDKPTNDTWQSPPVINDEATDEQDDEQTEFEEQCKQFLEGEHTRRKPTHRFNVADKLARLGEYALIVFGFADGRDLSTPVSGALEGEPAEFTGLDDLMYIATFGQDRVVDWELDTEMTSPRFRRPERFEVLVDEPDEDDDPREEDTQLIHWTRCIHVPEGTLEDDLRGTSALKAVFHELLNIDKIKAASGEGYWRGGYQGMVIRPPTDPSGRLMEFADDGDGVEKEIRQFLNNFERTIATTADISTLESTIPDPRPHLQINYEAISAALDMPKSILTGEDRADTAASEDVRQWHQKIGQRRNDHAGPVILEPTIQRLIDVGVLPEPTGDGFVVEWQPLDELSEREERELQHTMSKTLANLSPGNDPSQLASVPELRTVIGWTPAFGEEVDEEFREDEEEEGLEVDEAALAAFEENAAAPLPAELQQQAGAGAQADAESTADADTDDD